MGRRGEGKKVNKKQVRRQPPVEEVVPCSSSGAQASPTARGLARSPAPPGMTIGEWLRLLDVDSEEAGTILLATLRKMGAQVRIPLQDRDDVAAEAVSRALSNGHEALLRARSSTPLGAWLRGCVRMVSLELIRSRKGEQKKIRIEEVSDPAPSAFQVAAEGDELKFETTEMLRAAHAFPRPYGHVLVWSLIGGLSVQQVHERLIAFRPAETRPIGRRQTEKLIRTAMEMARDYIAGGNPRTSHHQKYLPKKNPWIGSHLPPLMSQIKWRAQRGAGPGTPQEFTSDVSGTGFPVKGRTAQS